MVSLAIAIILATNQPFELCSTLMYTLNGLNPACVCYFLDAADLKVTQRSFNFGKKKGLPFYFVSAADGTNVVKVI